MARIGRGFPSPRVLPRLLWEEPVVPPIGPPLSNRAIYRFWVGWDGRNAGVFRIGVSTIAPNNPGSWTGYDRIGYGYTPNFGSTIYDNITNQDANHKTHDGSIRRGRSDDLGPIQAGSVDIEIVDTDGRFNPKSTGSPLNGKVKSARPVKVEMSVDDGASWKLRFYGWSDEHKSDPRNKRSFIHASDMIEAILANEYPVIPSMGSTTVGAAIGAVLDWCEWSNPTMRSIAAGDQIPDFTADGSKTARSLVEELIVIDPGGAFFQDVDGVVVYEPRYVKAAKAVSSTLNNEMIAIAPGQRLRDVVNVQGVLREAEGAELQTAEDPASRGEYGRRQGSQINTLYLNTDPEARALAAEIVRLRADGIDAIYALPLANKNAALLDILANRDLQDRVSLIESLHGTSDEYIIESIEERVSDGGTIHRTSWKCSDAPDTVPFRVGVSLIAPDDPGSWGGYHRIVY